MKFQSNAIFNGTITANSVADAGTNTDKFLVLNSSGVVTYRTAAELYSDLAIGSLPAGYTSTLKHAVKAGVALTKGQAVYVTSADGTNMIVGKASNASEATSSKTLGLVESSLSLNGIGNVITEGLLAGLDTTGANAAGDPVWLGTDGNLVYGIANKPYAPAHMVFIGVVTRVNANNGEIFVKVQNGFEMSELHNYAEGSVQNNQVIVYESATSLYKPKSIATILGYTPVPTTRTITINGTTYDLSADRSWTVEGGGGTSASTRTVQKYTADGSSATYTVTGGYTVGMVDVYVNGIKLDNASGVEFTATNGTTVVLTSTPASGDIVEVYKYGSQFIATNALRQTTLFTATAGQTTFTVNYSVGLVDVYYNGSKLDSSEYTASNGTTIVFGTACVVNDKVEVVAYTYNATGYTGVAYSGTPTTNYLTKWTSTGTIGNSSIFDNGTNVGIGTTSPAYPLEVYYNSSTAYTTSSRGNVMRVYNPNTGANIFAGIELGGAGTANDGLAGLNAVVTASGSAALTFYTRDGGTFLEKLRVAANGNIGIGTTTPSQKLSISYSDGGAQTIIYNTSTGHSVIANNTANKDINYQVSGTGGHYFLGLLDVASRGITKGSMPAGTILQVVNYQLNSGGSTTSSSDVDTGLNVSITPTSSTSKILIIISASIRATGSGGNTYFYGKLWRGAISSGTLLYDGFPMMGNYGSSDIRGIANVTILDSPATTSTVTYRFSMNAGYAPTVYINSTTSPSTITVMEIAQ